MLDPEIQFGFCCFIYAKLQLGKIESKNTYYDSNFFQ